MAISGIERAQAQYYWDANGDSSGVGGTGTWNFVDLTWRNGQPYNPLVAWVDGSWARLYTGADCKLTLETNIVVSLSWFVNCTIDGPYTLQLTSASKEGGGAVGATINCPVIIKGGNRQYNNAMTFNGNISDDGGNRALIHYVETLTLNGSNSFGGYVSLMSGELVIGNDHAIGTGSLSLGYDGAVLKAGGGARTITNSIGGNWNWRLYLQGTNNLTCTATNTLKGTAAPYPRYNIVETNTVLTYGGLVRDWRYNTMMIKEGPGTFVIEGAYDANYGTVVTGGTLIVNGTTTMPYNNYGYTVFPGATLGGTGLIMLAVSGSTCTVQQAGALAPGAGPGVGVGTLTITNGTVALGEGAILKWDYKDGAGDRVAVKGTLILPSVATVMVSRISGDVPATPTLFTANTLAGPGAADVSGWVVQGVKRYAAKIQGTAVILFPKPASGTVITIR
jgi:autotransporter-associated beta strand protein